MSYRATRELINIYRKSWRIGRSYKINLICVNVSPGIFLFLPWNKQNLNFILLFHFGVSGEGRRESTPDVYPLSVKKGLTYIVHTIFTGENLRLNFTDVIETTYHTIFLYKWYTSDLNSYITSEKQRFPINCYFYKPIF